MDALPIFLNLKNRHCVVIGGGVRVAALAVVNALGDVIDPKNGRIIAGARKSPESREFANTAEAIKAGAPGGFTHGNTTLVVVATDARLNRVEAGKLAQVATIGMARAISPVFTMSDGDICFALSAGDKRAPVDALGAAASEAVAEAILRAVRLAPSTMPCASVSTHASGVVSNRRCQLSRSCNAMRRRRSRSSSPCAKSCNSFSQVARHSAMTPAAAAFSSRRLTRRTRRRICSTSFVQRRT